MKIGELAQRSGCEVVTVRYYEQEGLLPKPPRSAGNYRIYNEQHVERLRFLRHCRSLDMTLNEVRALLALRDQPNHGCDDVNTLLESHIAKVEERIDSLQQLKQQLQSLLYRCSGDHSIGTCEIIRGLSE